MKPPFKCSHCGQTEMYDMDISGGFAYCSKCGEIFPNTKKNLRKNESY